MNIYQEIGKRLQEIRLKCDLTQERLSELSGISSNFISQIERGKNKCSVETIYKLATALDIPMNDLFNPKVSNPVKDPYIKRMEIMLKNLSKKDKDLVMDITEDTYNKLSRHKR